MGDTVNDLLDNLTDAMLAREDSCHGLSRPHERDRAITQWHNAVSAIHEALTREPLPTGTAGVSEPVSRAYRLPATVQAIVDAAAAYEKWQGKWYDYTVASGEKAAKQQRALIEAVRTHRAALAASTRTGEDAHPTTPTRGSDE